jgi:hypothetical protein
MIRRTPLRRVSKKRAAANKIYLAKRKVFMASRRLCEAGLPCCTKWPQDVHHASGRSGTNMLDDTTWMAVCRACHSYIHNHPGASRSLGLIK